MPLTTTSLPPRWALTLEALPDAALVIGLDELTVQDANGAAEALFGSAPGGLAGEPARALMPGCAPILRALTPMSAVCTKLEGRRRNGVPLRLELRARDLDATGSRALCLLGLPDREGVWTAAQRHFDVAFEHAPIGMALFNTDGEYVRVNGALCRMLGRPEEALLSTRDQLLTHPDDRQRDLQIAERILEGEFDTWQTEKRFLRPDGSVVWVIANLTFLRDEAGLPLSWVGQFQDISVERAQQHQLRRLAERDPLTELFNRRRFEAELERHVALAAQTGTWGAVLLLDVDRFKAINDSRGHLAGDDVLRTIADVLRGRLRSTDVLARIGGDEFAALLPDIDPESAGAVAADLDALIRRAQAPGALSASVGLAVFGPDGQAGAKDVLAVADTAMYAAKRAARGARRAQSS